jgi:hypothetical protein
MKNSCLKIQMVKTCFVASSIPQANCFWADFGIFWEFWADFAALAVADSMPELQMKSLKFHNL